MGSGDLFGTFRAEHRKLSRHLQRVQSQLYRSIEGPDSLDFDLPDTMLVEALLDAVAEDLEPPALADFFKSGPKEISYFDSRGYRAFLVVDVSGSADLVNYWPDEIPGMEEYAYDAARQESGADVEPAKWRLREPARLSYMFEYYNPPPGEDPPDLGAIFAEQQERAEAIVAAVATQTEQFHESMREHLTAVIKRLRSNYEAAHAVFESIRLPIYRPPTSTDSDRHQRPRDRAGTVDDQARAAALCR